MDRFLDLHDISIHTSCRTCLENLNHTYHNIFASPDLLKKISLCTSLLVESGDEFPTNLCEPCYAKINDFYDFKQMCIVAAERYQEYINSDKKPCALELDIDPNSQKRFIVFNKCEEKDNDQYSQSTKHETFESFEVLNNINVKEEDYDQYPQIGEHEPSSKEEEIYKIKDHQAKSGNDISKLHENEDINVEIKTVKTPKTNLKCEICKKVFKKARTLKTHMCEKSFKRPHNKKSHERIHIREYLNECGICHRKFKHPCSLSRHKKLHLRPLKRHGAVDNKLSNVENQHEFSTKKDTLDPKSHTSFQVLNKCEEKDNDTYSQSSEHEPSSKKEILNKLDYNQFECHYSSKNSKNENLTYELKIVKNKNIIMCKICKKFFRKAETFKRHICVHKTTKSLACLYCKKICLDLKTKKFHEMIHTVQRPYKCNICYKKFRNPSSFIQHKNEHEAVDNKHSNVDSQHSSSSKEDKLDSKGQNRFTVLNEYEEKSHNLDEKLCAPECAIDPNTQNQSIILREYKEDNHDQYSEFGEYELSVIKTKHASSSKKEELEKRNDYKEILKYDDDCQNSTYIISELNENEDTTAEIKTTLMCEICNKLTKNVDALQKHMRVHNGLKPYPCSYCKKSFNRVDNRRFHEKKHTKQSSHECDICHIKFFILSNLEKHRKIHLEDLDEHKGLTNVTCQLCFKSFTKPNQLKDHINEHENSLKETGSFQYLEIVDDMLSNIKNEYESTSKEDELDKSDEVLPIEKNDKECENSSNDRSKLNENEDSTKEIKIVTYRKTNLICEICKRLFQKAETLERHMRVHNGLKPYLCSYCGCSFNRVYCRNVHEMIHTKQRPYECEVCHRKFTTNANLNRHRIFHLNQEKLKEKKFMCEICKKCFKKAETLEKHIPVHNGLKKFPCSYCEISFGRAINRTYHERTHTGEKPHECNICRKKFVRPFSLKRHLKIHLKL